MKLDRRQFGATLAGGLFSSMLLEALTSKEAFAAGKTKAKAKACIVLWMNGGPSHIDTFDPKPGTASGGKFKAIKTRAAGVQISEHLPLVAEQAQHMAFIRSMSTKEGNHDRARYMMHTGYAPNPTVIHPALGGWVSEELGEKEAELPAFVSLGGPSAPAGFLGAQHDPFVVPKIGATPANTGLPKQVDDARFGKRREALDLVEASFGERVGGPMVEGRRAIYAQAMRMMKSTHLKAFDPSDEPDAVKKDYGDTDFGRGCLVARRLVESGVKLVEVTLDGWDTHQDVFGRTTKLMSALDPAMAALVKDLDKRHLLDSTLVVWMGDFGRTPKINANEGRDHFPNAWSAVLAGGGIKGGIAHGKTDADGAKVVEKPVTPSSLNATLVTLLGMDPGKSFATPSGRPISITEMGVPIPELMR